MRVTNKYMELIEVEKSQTPLRIIWKNEGARDNWERVIQTLSNDIQELELISVAKDQRPCAWRTVRETELVNLSEKCRELGLMVFPVRRVGIWEGFVHFTPQPDPNRISNVYCVIAKDMRNANGFIEAHKKQDHEKQGAFLGFPSCCTNSFASNWANGFFDPMWQAHYFTMERGLKTSPYVNPLLRYIGIRGSFHIPCSFHCNYTKTVSKQRLNLLPENKKKLVLKLLSMDMEWSCLNGIGIVDTPIFKIVTGTVPTKIKYQFKVSGSFKPKYGDY